MEARGMRYPEQTPIHRHAETRSIVIRICLSFKSCIPETSLTQFRLTCCTAAVLPRATALNEMQAYRLQCAAHHDEWELP